MKQSLNLGIIIQTTTDQKNKISPDVTACSKNVRQGMTDVQ
jgi:hypothetical protein